MCSTLIAVIKVSVVPAVGERCSGLWVGETAVGERAPAVGERQQWTSASSGRAPAVGKRQQ